MVFMLCQIKSMTHAQKLKLLHDLTEQSVTKNEALKKTLTWFLEKTRTKDEQ